MDSDLKEKIAKECVRIEEDSEHSFKSHYNAAEFWSGINLWLGLPAALLGAVAGGSSAADGAQAMITGTAFFSTALVTCMTFLKPSEKADSHKNAGNLYQSLRNETRVFRGVELGESLSAEEGKQALHKLASRRDELNTTMPAIPRKAYEKAKKDIDSGRSKYQVDRKSK
ncbi:SLATT domain-containing protein [Neiella sp. HB171785]|uniref:SLATT domain-containing protein n=1 Tax=Neiella litorisoli TaxID=2771431 RepID=A0A8J6QG56_9GAMM|nr:SLATT domain-containing protein [Neiella litorisoli]MBD1389259.1 SLATT domain-containing protein [Neiella litorisoli]